MTGMGTTLKEKVASIIRRVRLLRIILTTRSSTQTKQREHTGHTYLQTGLRLTFLEPSEQWSTLPFPIFSSAQSLLVFASWYLVARLQVQRQLQLEQLQKTWDGQVLLVP